jgi:hypothetical protein
MKIMIENKLIDEAKLYANFKDLLSVLKNCIDDDWAPKLRFTCVVLIRVLMEYL